MQRIFQPLCDVLPRLVCFVTELRIWAEGYRVVGPIPPWEVRLEPSGFFVELRGDANSSNPTAGDLQVVY